jgi:hypothetical protein
MTETLELRFNASLQGIEAGRRRLATFYIMDTGVNRNGWRVTEEALNAALPSLLGKPLGCVPGYRVDHVHHPLTVGRFVSADMGEGCAVAVAEVTDTEAWSHMDAGEWGPVSVVIRATRVTCSGCGADITGGPDEHVLTGSAHEVVEVFAFERVDFVSEPAYPRAGVVQIGEYTSSSNWDGRGGAQGTRSKPPGEQTMDENSEALRAENTRLRGRIQGLEAEKRRTALEDAVAARLRAGLARDKQAETEKLGTLEDAALTLLAEDAEAVAERLTRTHAAGPKARNDPGHAAYTEELEQARTRLFGHRGEDT